MQQCFCSGFSPFRSSISLSLPLILSHFLDFPFPAPLSKSALSLSLFQGMSSSDALSRIVDASQHAIRAEGAAGKGEGSDANDALVFFQARSRRCCKSEIIRAIPPRCSRYSSYLTAQARRRRSPPTLWMPASNKHAVSRAAKIRAPFLLFASRRRASIAVDRLFSFVALSFSHPILDLTHASLFSLFLPLS